MPRRTATMLASTLMLIALLCAGVFIDVPYSEMSPGPTVNTLGNHGGEPVLRIEGRRTYDTAKSSHLNMTTVRVTSAEYRMNLLEAVAGWMAHDTVVVPHATLYPDGQTQQQSTQENAEEFSQSQESAKVAALREEGIRVDSRVIVASVLKDAPAEGALHAGDVIREVDGMPVAKPQDVARLVREHKPGEKVDFQVVPAAKAEVAAKAHKETRTTRTVRVGTEKSKDGRTVVGIEPGVGHVFPFDIDIELADVGGPSAGLMFALGIVDKLTPGDLTGGKFVAGTGTIDDDGKVGPIGGIALKTIGARKQGARYFLTPEENCAAAAADVPDGLTLVKVGTIEDATAALKDLREGRTSALPRCTK